MTQAELFALMERFDQSGLWELCYRTGEEKITLRKGPAAPLPPAPPAAAPMTPASPAVQNAAPAAPAPAPKKEGKEVTAPLVGTFYAAPAPGEEPFAPVGKHLQKGDTLCLIEAMKMINQVPAPFDCEVLEVLGENGQLVSFGQTLFRLKEC